MMDCRLVDRRASRRRPETPAWNSFKKRKKNNESVNQVEMFVNSLDVHFRVEKFETVEVENGPVD